MKNKQSALAIAITAVLALGASQQAAAYVYAGSTIEIQNLNIVVTGAGAGTKINSFQFTATNTATLNGASAIVGTGGNGLLTASCGGTPGLPGTTNNCTPGLGVPRLDPGAANAPGSNPVRANNDFTLMGPGLPVLPGGQYSNSDSVIYVSELTLDPVAPLGIATHTQQISESELQGGASARANAELTSTTSFLFRFTIAGGGGLIFGFDANPYMRVAIGNDPGFANGNAQANLVTSFSLTQDSTGDSITWSPQGTNAFNDCNAGDFGGAITCTETSDGGGNAGTDLNRTLSIGSINSAEHSPLGVFNSYGINLAGLTDGDWSFGLTSVTSTSVRRVPEPGMLALMGIGFMGFGFSALRKKRT